MTGCTAGTLALGPVVAEGDQDGDVLRQLFGFDHYGELLALAQGSLLAGVLVGLVGGLAGVFVIMRDLPFAVHGISELSFAGASVALFLGLNIVAGSIAGSLLAAVAIGVLGVRARDRNSVIGIIMPFGLGLGVLFLSLYKGRTANKFGLLTGQIVAVSTPQTAWLAGTSAVVLAALAVMWRPLAFASADPEVAAARGVPVRALSTAFMLALGLAVALCVQTVGALLVLSLLVTPAAAAARVTASPVLLPLLSVVFALVSMEGGLLLALGATVPVSPYVTTISFVIYLACRLVGSRQGRRGAGSQPHAGRTHT
ncbi:metal ABC transporter permease [Streptomyces sp. LX-29]|uniref:metal ABC transporter permease n=1 Tax=Streptomyces sp. LX-29 TaxID=2900152 RepID=UPI00240D54CD|nr:metal ABC transporter permease [Streptomyces sp. LX-29]WFB10482.1 metal ABC transporter permease [Streptomyces sp. LX-29]